VLGYTAEIIAVIALVLPFAVRTGLADGRRGASRSGLNTGWFVSLPVIWLLFGKHLTRLKIVKAFLSLVCERALRFWKNRLNRLDIDLAGTLPALG